MGVPRVDVLASTDGAAGCGPVPAVRDAQGGAAAKTYSQLFGLLPAPTVVSGYGRCGRTAHSSCRTTPPASTAAAPGSYGGGAGAEAGPGYAARSGVRRSQVARSGSSQPDVAHFAPFGDWTLATPSAGRTIGCSSSAAECWNERRDDATWHSWTGGGCSSATTGRCQLDLGA